MNKIFKKSKSDNRLKRIEYRGKYLRASRTGGVALRAQGKAAGINFTVNSKHGTRVSKRIAKGTNVGFQNGRFVLRGRYGKGPTKLNLSKSGVSVSSKTSVGTINWFKPKYSSAKIGGIQFRGDNALIIQGVVALFQIFYFFMTLTFKIGFWLLKTTFWLLKALFEAIILMFTKFKEHRLSRKQKAVEVLEVNWCEELQNQSIEDLFCALFYTLIIIGRGKSEVHSEFINQTLEGYEDKEVLEEANKYMDKGQLLVLVSTVLPGTTRREFINLITNTRFVYNPYLIAMGTVAWDMINPDMVMIGTEDGEKTEDAGQLVSFYHTIMENTPQYHIGTWDECECIKVFYNTFISMKIGLVNMIQDVAQKQGNINVDIVTGALASSKQRLMSKAYMKAGMGDGGACHPRDNIALRYMAENLDLQYDIFDSIMNAREVQAKNLAQLLVFEADAAGLPIILNGISYKPGVSYTAGSYSLLVGHYCKELGQEVIEIDPLAMDHRFEEGPYSAVVLLAHPELYIFLNIDSIVVDPWREYTNDSLRVIHYGNTRKNKLYN